MTNSPDWRVHRVTSSCRSHREVKSVDLSRLSPQTRPVDSKSLQVYIAKWTFSVTVHFVKLMKSHSTFLDLMKNFSTTSTHVVNSSTFNIQYRSGLVVLSYSKDSVNIDWVFIRNYFFVEENTCLGLGVFYSFINSDRIYDIVGSSISVNSVRIPSAKKLKSAWSSCPSFFVTVKTIDGVNCEHYTWDFAYTNLTSITSW